ncbi:ABC transporter substrate-binding protein [Streptomyces sp. NPDC059649]|uniref:ABC transporter substrate-binding protein n=1 Tax=Streptomyces sp. NPDC059649 TaxID=3346895 RepID=UPI00367F323F
MRGNTARAARIAVTTRTARTAAAGRTARTAVVVGAVVAVAAGLAGCGGPTLEEKGGGDGKGGKRDEIVIGSAGFTESKVLAEIYSRLLQDAGYRTRVQTLANRELYEPALEKGQIDVVPEYASTLAEFLNVKKNGSKAKPVASGDIGKTVAALKKLAGPRGLKVLPAGRATDQNAFAVSKEFAAQHKLSTLSDLGASKQKITLASGEECETRVFCKPGLEKTYGIDIAGLDPKGVGTPQAKQAVKDGTDQLVLTTTTDATLDSFGLVLLKDDKHLQNADNVLPVVNAGSAGEKRIERALGKLTRVLTTDDLIDLNRKVDAERLKPGDVAQSYVESKGLVRK